MVDEFQGELLGRSELTGVLDARYSFTAQFLLGASLHCALAHEIEAKPVCDVTEADRMAHRSFVVSAIAQSCASLESEIWEVTNHGPGHHLGSSDLNREGQAFLEPVADVIDRQGTLERFETVLHLLRKPSLPRGEQLWHHASLLVKLRNEIVHYKSNWFSKPERTRLLTELRALKHPVAPFWAEPNQPFFPMQCLSAACGDWAVRTGVLFLDAFYAQVGVSSVLDGYRDRLPTN